MGQLRMASGTTFGTIQNQLWRIGVRPQSSATGLRLWKCVSSGEGAFLRDGRYHLYVLHACPWAHRTLIFRKLKQLEDHISVSVVHPDMLTDGWTFETDDNGGTGDTLTTSFARDVYIKADPESLVV